MTTRLGAIRLPLLKYPGMNPFVLDWLDGKPAATSLVPRSAARPRPRGAREVTAELRDALVDSNRRWGIDASSDVAAWADGAITIVAGQQVGIGGGPLYTLAKLATIVKMKREAEAKGERAVAFFWLATEDHDYDEAAVLAVPAKIARRESPTDLLTLRAVGGSAARSVVGRQPIPRTLASELDALLDLGSPEWLREGITFGDSFAELIASVLGNEVVLIDALLPELRRAGAPLLGAIASRTADAQRALAQRAAAIRDAGYREQVTARGEEYTLLFSVSENGVRTPLDGGASVPAETISTSALTRPLLQDAVLRPDVFVGGPAEVAYYAQVSALHELFGVEKPRVALRGHALVAPARLLRAAEKHGLQLEMAGPEVLVAPLETTAADEIERTLDDARGELLRAVERVAGLAMPADHALAARIGRSVGHLEYHLDKLRERSVRALLRRDRERFAAARELASTLYPDGIVQDRVVSWLALWSRYGTNLVDAVTEQIEPDSSSFIIVGI